MVYDLLCRGTNEWNVAKVENLLPTIAKEILSIRPSVLGATDRYVWPPNKDGRYLTKSGYITATKNRKTLDNDDSQTLELQWTKKIWSSACLPKIQLFILKLCQGALPLGANLEKRVLRANVSCPRCGERETTEHLILHCQFAKYVWAEAPFQKPLLVDSSNLLTDAIVSGLKLVCLPPVGVSSPLFLWICWGSWIARNILIF